VGPTVAFHYRDGTMCVRWRLDGIKRKGDHDRSVERALLETWTSNQSVLGSVWLRVKVGGTVPTLIRGMGRLYFLFGPTKVGLATDRWDPIVSFF